MKIGVIMGGPSSEREISLLTGKEMMVHLDKNKYEVVPMSIENRKELIEKVMEEKIDFALLALHGKFGEDGGAQAVLEGLHIPYSGSGMVASSLCMDKDLTKRLLKSENIPTPPWVTMKKEEEIPYAKLEEIGYPFVVKPVNGGSSIGTFIVRSSEEMVEAVLKALDYDEEVMIEKYMEGTEITCSMLEGELFPILAIRPTSIFFDYAAKYEEGGAEEKVIQLEGVLKEKIEKICFACWSLFKCAVYGRIDIILQEEEPYVLEMNTLPGMTKQSLFPKSAAALGMSYETLIDRIITSSLKRKI